jgi:hypothetical protein
VYHSTLVLTVIKQKERSTDQCGKDERLCCRVQLTHFSRTFDVSISHSIPGDSTCPSHTLFTNVLVTISNDIHEYSTMHRSRWRSRVPTPWGIGVLVTMSHSIHVSISHSIHEYSTMHRSRWRRRARTPEKSAFARVHLEHYSLLHCNGADQGEEEE